MNSLHINNFRGIKEGEIKGLSDVNVFIGKNNSGKSTILDSLLFLQSGIKTDDIFGRSILNQIYMRRVRRPVRDLKIFLYNYQLGSDPNLKVNFDGQEFQIPISYDGSRFTINFNEEALISRIDRAGNLAYEYVRGTSSGGRTNLSSFFQEKIDEGSFRRDEQKNRYKKFQLLKPFAIFLSEIVIVDSETLNLFHDVERTLWQEVFEQRLDKRFLNNLNETYSENIQQLSMYPSDGSSRLMALLEDVGRHIDDYGDGMRNTLLILSIISQLKDTALLLEEPEISQHPGAYRTMLQNIISLAGERNVQLFITTHSIELVKTIANLDNTAAIYHTSLNNGLFEARRIEGADAKLMTDLGVDLRALSNIQQFLVVEGNDDKAFLQNIAKKLENVDLENIGYTIVLSQKKEQLRTVNALASTGRKIAVFQDLDNEDKTNIIGRFGQSLQRYDGVSVDDDKIKIAETESVVKVIPMGLPELEEFKDIEITKHSMEDYLLALLCKDEKVKDWAEVNLADLKDSARGLKDVTNIQSSKTLLCALGTKKGGLDIGELVERMIMTSKEDTLTEVVKPIINYLFDE